MRFGRFLMIVCSRTGSPARKTFLGKLKPEIKREITFKRHWKKIHLQKEFKASLTLSLSVYVLETSRHPGHVYPVFNNKVDVFFRSLPLINWPSDASSNPQAGSCPVTLHAPFSQAGCSPQSSHCWFFSPTGFASMAVLSWDLPYSPATCLLSSYWDSIHQHLNSELQIMQTSVYLSLSFLYIALSPAQEKHLGLSNYWLNEYSKNTSITSVSYRLFSYSILAVLVVFRNLWGVFCFCFWSVGFAFLNCFIAK